MKGSQSRSVALLLVVALSLVAASCREQKEVAREKGFVMGTGYYAAPNTPVPQKANRFPDPDFNTTLQRITSSADHYIGPGIENEYSKMDPENCQGTLLVLRGNSGAYYLYDPVNCKLIRQVKAFDACDYAEPEPRWDRSDPGVFYYLCDTELRRYDVGKNASTVVHDFRKEFPGAAYITTKSEGDASLDRRYWCFMVQDPHDSLLAVTCYDRTEDRVAGRKTGGFPDDINWVGMSMSGEHCMVGYEDRVKYTQVFSRDFENVTTLPDGSAGHGDAAMTGGGRDVYVYQNVSTDYISFADMGTGDETKLLKIPFGVNSDIGLHVSGNCAGTPGWVLVSTYGSLEPPQGRKHSWMDEQLFMLELDRDPRVWRIAHTRSYTSREYSGDKNYFAEAFASINTGGTRVLWGSNWRDFTTDYTDTYQAVLPDGWAGRLPEPTR